MVAVGGMKRKSSFCKEKIVGTIIETIVELFAILQVGIERRVDVYLGKK